MNDWVELADGVFYHRFEPWHVNVGLVVGATTAMVIDTRASPGQGRELRESVERMTRRPLIVVNTHAHLDHCLGNRAFSDLRQLAHPAAVRKLANDGPSMLSALSAVPGTTPEELGNGSVVVPSDPVDRDRLIDLGGCTVALQHHGRGHTDGDLVVEVTDARVAFTGDLVRQDALPWFEDSFPMEWPTTLDHMLLRLPFGPPASSILDPATESRPGARGDEMSPSPCGEHVFTEPVRLGGSGYFSSAKTVLATWMADMALGQPA